MRPEREIEADWEAVCASGRRTTSVIADDKAFGDVLKEVFIAENAGDIGDYVKLAQKIRRTDGEQWIRFTYYVKRPGWESWRFAGQNSLMLSLEPRLAIPRREAGEHPGP